MTPSRPSRIVLAVMAIGLMASACATPSGPARPQGSTDVMVSGEGGLALSGPDTPAALTALLAAPYGLPSPPDCAVMARDIAHLDGILGPDVDAIAASRNDSGQAVGSAMRSIIPYRWVMRLMTQAGRRDRELRLAVLAGTARRGYLKGVRHGLACPPAPGEAGP